MANSIFNLSRYKIYRKLRKRFFKKKFKGSKSYWEKRYSKKGNSGAGSYDQLAEFKAKVVNEFVQENEISTTIEFGCGDGNQLSFANYKEYIGLDVSPTAIKICNQKFKDDDTKSFFLYDSLAFFDNKGVFKAELALSLDVIYHLVENDVFENYMKHLFDSAEKYVVIYSSNHPHYSNYHVKSRKFTDWISENIKGWEFVRKIDNDIVDWADFYIYKKMMFYN